MRAGHSQRPNVTSSTVNEIIMPGRTKDVSLLLGKGNVGSFRVAYEVVLEEDRLDLVPLTVRVGDAPSSGDLVVPRTFKATVTDPPGPARRRVTILVSVDDAGHPGVAQMAVEAEEGTVMRAKELRALNLPKYLDAAVAAVTREADLDAGRWREPLDGMAAVSEAKRRRAGRRPVSDETLELVAKLYREAIAAGLPTAAYISERLDEQPSISATRRWIMLARQRAFLPPAGATDEEG